MKNMLVSVLLMLVLVTENTIFGQSIAALNDSVETLYAQGKYAEAFPYAQEALRLGKIKYGENCAEIGEYTNNLAAVYWGMGEYEKGETLFLAALKIDSVTIGTDHPEFASHLSNLAILYKRIGQYEKAEPLYLAVLKIDSSTCGTNHPKFANHVSNLGKLYMRMGEYEKAEPMYLATLKIDSVTIGTDHRNFSIHLNNLAMLYMDIGEFEKAEHLYIEALEIDTVTIGTMHPGFAVHLSNLSILYESMGEYKKAEHLIMAALKIDSATLGANHPAISTHFNNLAGIYRNIGELEKAEPLLLAALKIDSATLGSDHPAFAIHLCNLASLYQSMGVYKKAETMYLAGLKIDSSTIGTGHPDFAAHLNNLGEMYNNMGEFEKAEPLLVAALKIDSVALGANHPILGIFLNNLAILYMDLGRYKKAEQMFFSSLEIDSVAFGTYHPAFSTHLNNLATLNSRIGAFENAESLHLAALEIDSVILPADHPQYVDHLRNLAIYYMKTRNQEMIKTAASPAFAIARQNAISWMSVLSRNQQTAYCRKHCNQFSANHTFVFAREHIQANLADIGYESCLLEKGILLRSDQAFQRISANIHSKSTREKVDNLQSLNRRILKTDESNNPNQVKRRAILQDQAEILQKELLREVPEFKDYLNELKITWPEVQANLNETSAAIEFVHFPFFDGEKESGYWYGAYILKKRDTLPQFVGLCPADTLQKTLGSEHESHDVQAYVKSLYGLRGVTPGRIDPNMTRQLYQLIWKPLDSLLQGVSQVYYSPAGILHNVAFAALPITDSTVLSDKYRLVQMGTTGTLTKGRKDLHAHSINNAAVFGGMGYDLDGDSIRNRELAMGLNRGGENGKAIRLESGLKVYPWQTLPGTKTECDSVVHKFKVSGIPAVGYSGPAASEGVFGSLEGEWGADYTREISPTLIHVATHGFSIPVRPRPVDFNGFGNRVERFHWSEDPLRRAGLIFSGANHVWTGHAPMEGRDDGILSAAEIAVMDLSDTRLVVLSACQTGLGDIVGNEGVFGLQRAFKLAGVELVIASLWRVPDKETAEFMGLFYGNFVGGMEVREAFRVAQDVMKERYRDEPYKWAAFVLME